MDKMNITENDAECPLCMELLDDGDYVFFPCVCGYQVCRFCWHRIRTDENGRCPGCRNPYLDDPDDYAPLSSKQISFLESKKEERKQQLKEKNNRYQRHLSSLKVVQNNLVFVVGLSERLANSEILKTQRYFGKYGKIQKVILNANSSYLGIQGRAVSAYITYFEKNDALNAIKSVNNMIVDGQKIRATLGTSKYCSNFINNQQCPRNDCLYLHELGDPEASFTKEEISQKKHQEYEKRLLDALGESSNENVIYNTRSGQKNSDFVFKNNKFN